MSAVLSLVEKLQPSSIPNAELSKNQHSLAYVEMLKKLVRTAPEELSAKDIIFFLLSQVYGLEIAFSATSDVLRSGSLGHILADAGVRLREQSPELIEFWLLCEVIRTTMKQISQDEIKRKAVQFSSWFILEDYLRHTLAYEREECFRILHLDTQNFLIKDELHSRGVVNHVPIYLGKVIKSVLDHRSSAVMILHNHPSHSTRVSNDDIEMTCKLEHALKSVEVKFLDHIIVCGPRYVSMRALNYIGV